MTAVMPAGVATARDLVGPAMATAITRLSPEVRPVAAYHLGLAGVNGHAPANGRAGGEAKDIASASSGPTTPPKVPKPADGNASDGSARPGSTKPAGSGKALRPALA